MKDIKHVICGYICSNSNGNKLMSFFFEILYASLIFFCLPKKRKIAHSHGMQEINWGGGGCHENVTLCRSGDILSSDGAISQ